MTHKEPIYNIRCFLENGTPITQEHQHLMRINQVSKFQTKGIVKKLNEMPKEVGEVVLNQLLHLHT